MLVEAYQVALECLKARPEMEEHVRPMLNGLSVWLKTGRRADWDATTHWRNNPPLWVPGWTCNLPGYQRPKDCLRAAVDIIGCQKVLEIVLS